MNNMNMKGLLKGLRYISQIFEPNSKDPEMEIGYPTNVKHVAHIGWDGPSVHPPSPSWMDEFRSTPLTALGAGAVPEDTPSGLPSQDLILNQSDVALKSMALLGSPAGDKSQPWKPTRQNKSAPSSPCVYLPELPISKSSRRHASTGSNMMETESDGSTQLGRMDLPAIPKQPRWKKKKGWGSSGDDGVPKASPL